MTFSISNSQTNFQAIDIIEKIIIETQDTNRIYYADSILKYYRYNDIMKALQKRKYSSYLSPNEKTSIKLTRSEIKYLISQIELQRDEIWPDQLFANSEKVQSDSLWATLKKIWPNQIPRDFKATKRVWEFTQPIVFRNGSCALIYYLNFCGGECGNDELSFYTRAEGEWKKMVRVRAGVF